MENEKFVRSVRELAIAVRSLADAMIGKVLHKSTATTPTPWSVYAYNQRAIIGTVDPNNPKIRWIAGPDPERDSVAMEVSEENAELIVRSVNHYPALVNALQNCMAELDSSWKNMGQTSRNRYAEEADIVLQLAKEG